MLNTDDFSLGWWMRTATAGAIGGGATNLGKRLCKPFIHRVSRLQKRPSYSSQSSVHFNTKSCWGIYPKKFPDYEWKRSFFLLCFLLWRLKQNWGGGPRCLKCFWANFQAASDIFAETEFEKATSVFSSIVLFAHCSSLCTWNGFTFLLIFLMRNNVVWRLLLPNHNFK